MIGSLSDSDIKGRLLAMDLSELRVDDQLRQASLRWPARSIVMTASCADGWQASGGSASRPHGLIDSKFSARGAPGWREKHGIAGFPARGPGAPLWECLADTFDFSDPDLWRSNSFASHRNRQGKADPEAVYLPENPRFPHVEWQNRPVFAGLVPWGWAENGGFAGVPRARGANFLL
jgi:hypothetical protein